jgi:hypothetical protein
LPVPTAGTLCPPCHPSACGRAAFPFKRLVADEPFHTQASRLVLDDDVEQNQGDFERRFDPVRGLVQPGTQADQNVVKARGQIEAVPFVGRLVDRHPGGVLRLDHDLVDVPIDVARTRRVCRPSTTAKATFSSEAIMVSMEARS